MALLLQLLPETHSNQIFCIVPPRPGSVLTRNKFDMELRALVVSAVTYTLLIPPDISLPMDKACPDVAEILRITICSLGLPTAIPSSSKPYFRSEEHTS